MNGAVGQQDGESEEKFRVIFNSVSDGIFVSDAETGTFTDVNDAGCTMFGRARDEIVGHGIDVLSTGVPPYTQRDAVSWFIKARSSGPQVFEWHCRTKDGHLFWGEISLRCVSFSGHQVGLSIVRDITERRRKQDELAEQARLDVLTALPNRRDFDFTLEQEIARSERYGAPLTVAMGDIDHFKVVNDTFGHPIGDAVLKSLAAFMRRHLRRIDYVARWGGEEFMIVLPETTIEVAEELLNRLRESIAKYVIPEIGGAVTLSFGVTTYRKSDTPDDLVKRIDAALYQSKATGRNKVSKV